MGDDTLSREEASDRLEALGWRVLERTLAASVAVASLERGLDIAAAAVRACGNGADDHLRVDVRADRVEMVLAGQSPPEFRFAAAETDAAMRITDAVADLGGEFITPASGADTGRRPAQVLEIAIDAMDIPAIRPFWKAVLSYADEPGSDDPERAIVDPVGDGPAIWFQQMDRPRPQRNRIHFDIIVAHDEADRRLAAALEAGGTLVSDARARAFWILADAEGNEICICTWQDRDA